MDKLYLRYANDTGQVPYSPFMEPNARFYDHVGVTNGYIYLAATRLSLFRSETDWAMVIEVFGFSPRAGTPDTQIDTFSSKPANRKTASNYVSQAAYENYLKNNPYNEAACVFPIDN